MQVYELFKSENLEKNDVIEREEDSGYWSSCSRFIQQVWEDDIDEMSEKQVTWVQKIIDTLVEERIKRRK